MPPETFLLAGATARIVEAYSASDQAEDVDIAELFRLVSAALVAAEATIGKCASISNAASYTRAVSVRKSLEKNDVILSMIDGNPYVFLKRHLKKFGLTPSDYIKRYRLPSDYPMIPASFKLAKIASARKSRLGHREADAGPISELSLAETRYRAWRAYQDEKGRSPPA